MIGNMTFGRKTGLKPQFQYLISLRPWDAILGRVPWNATFLGHV